MIKNKIDKDIIQKLINKKEWEKLIAYLDNHSNQKDNDLNTLLQYYKAYNALEKYNLAEEYLDKALLLNKENPTLWRDKGNYYLHKKDYENALSSFLTASSIRPDIASYHVSVANTYLFIEDLDNAIKYYKKALKINPKQLIWLKSLANLLIKNNNTSEAFDIYTKIIQENKDFQSLAIYQELKNQVQTGSKEASSEYYDTIFSNSKKYLHSAEVSIYTEIWLYIVSIIDKNKYHNIIDLGCGPGQFAEFLQTRLSSINYIGLDFSKSALTIAKQRCPNYQFINKKFPLKSLSSLGLHDVVICTEVLEHVELDIEILQSIQAGKPIIASVPNFDSFGHVRYFDSTEEIKNRYAFLFRNLKITSFSLSEKNTIWVLFGIKS